MAVHLMARCIGCGKEVYRYIVAEHGDTCMDCFSGKTVHRTGFKHDGKQMPTATDHCKNIGATKPTKDFQNNELAMKKNVSSLGGSVRHMPDVKQNVKQWAERRTGGKITVR